MNKKTIDDAAVLKALFVAACLLRALRTFKAPDQEHQTNKGGARERENPK